MATTSDFTTGKSILIIAVVIGCFAILWPKVFFPMIQAAFSVTKPAAIDGDQGHIRQERPPHAGPPVPHPALKEKGNPFPTLERGKPAFVTSKGKPGPMSSLRPPMGGGGPNKTGSSKGPGAMSLLMPIYTVGIVVFFLYTISKVLLRKPSDELTPKVMDFHMDPEYRKYVNSHEYRNGQPLSYKEYLRKKEEDDVKRTAKLLGDAGRKQVFTAIEGIIAEMDEYRERIMADQPVKTVTGEDETEGHQIADGLTSDSIQTAEGEILLSTVESNEKITKEKLEDELARITALSSDDTKIAVLGMETQVEFTEKPEEPQADEVSNIVLERSVSSDTQLLVAESQCLTHTTTEHIDGWTDLDEQPVIVTGKMTISLLGKEASVHLTESKTSNEHGVTCPTVNHAHISKRETLDRVNQQRKQIEELANALVDDILHNQVPKVLESNGAAPEVDDTFDATGPFGARPRVPPRKQFSRESINSQGSSFEYVSACQEVDLPQTPIAEESPTSGFHFTTAGEDYDDVNHVHSTGRSSNLSFECVSVGSVSPLSPEKVVSACENGSDQSPWHSQETHYSEHQRDEVKVNNGHDYDFETNHESNGDAKEFALAVTLESERLMSASLQGDSNETSAVLDSALEVDEEQLGSAEEEEEEQESRETTPELNDVKRFA